MSEEQSFRLFAKPEAESSTLVISWNQDAGRLGPSVVEYLKRKLEGQDFAEISPEGFFSLGGVTVEDDVARFPESKFYWFTGRNLFILESDIPQHDWYQFLSLVLDIAEKYGKVKEIYTIGGMVSAAAHTMPRTLLSVVNSPEMKKTLGHYDLVSDMNYETLGSQRPTFSSFLLWAAKRRGIAGANIWLPIPFYLLSVGDQQACKRVIKFLDSRLELNVDFADINEAAARQNKEIARVRSQLPEIDDYINKLEGNLGLTVEESEKLAREVDEWLSKKY